MPSDDSPLHISENSSSSGRRVALLHRYRWIIAPIFDSIAWISAIFAASFLRFRFDSGRAVTGGLLIAIAIAVVMQLGLGLLILYWRRWRLGSFEEIIALTATVGGVTMVLLVLSVATSRYELPLGVVLAASAFTLVLTAGSRCAWRLVREYRQHAGMRQGEDVIVFGMGQAGQQIVFTMLTIPDSPYRPVALLDDDPSKRNLQVRHLRVSGGRHQLRELAKRTRAGTVVIAIPSADSELIRQLSELATDADLEVRVLPPVSRIFTSEIGVEDIRPVTDADLLGRHAIDTEIESIAGYLTGRRVMVTGAGGSIGSELCRQIHHFAPSELIMLERDESGIHQTQLSIEGRAMLDSRSLVLCDIRDVDALETVFSEHRPEVVFHAAALKHLPLLEMWPGEAVKTNVLGTQNLIDASKRVGVGKFINISTDKAANPTSVLGYSKRIAERLVSAAGSDGTGTFLSVRFGNVLGSRGSVLTAFRAQIEAGGPLTVTDPAVTRYFMTVEEAVQLVIQAGAIGNSSEALILDMGAPVPIADVARQLIDQARRPVKIIYTGLRPGEKLHEDLFGDGEADERPCHPSISHVPVPGLAPAEISHIRLPGGAAAVTSMLREACVKTSTAVSFQRTST